jgi:hypothetical protein
MPGTAFARLRVNKTLEQGKMVGATKLIKTVIIATSIISSLSFAA